MLAHRLRRDNTEQAHSLGKVLRFGYVHINTRPAAEKCAVMVFTELPAVASGFCLEI